MADSKASWSKYGRGSDGEQIPGPYVDNIQDLARAAKNMKTAIWNARRAEKSLIKGAITRILERTGILNSKFLLAPTGNMTHVTAPKYLMKVTAQMLNASFTTGALPAEGAPLAGVRDKVLGALTEQERLFLVGAAAAVALLAVGAVALSRRY